MGSQNDHRLLLILRVRRVEADDDTVLSPRMRELLDRHSRVVLSDLSESASGQLRKYARREIAHLGDSLE